MGAEDPGAVRDFAEGGGPDAEIAPGQLLQAGNEPLIPNIQRTINQNQAMRVSANRNLAIGGSGICAASLGRIAIVFFIVSLLLLVISPDIHC
jgi:hypothetical protein